MKTKTPKALPGVTGGRFTKEQRALWKAVAAYILEEPRRLQMAVGIAKASNKLRVGDGCPLPKKDRPPCGTVSCLAGTAVIQNAVQHGKTIAQLAKELGDRRNEDLEAVGLPAYSSNDELPWDEIKDEATVLLGLDPFRANRVFYQDEWPNSYGKEYERATTALGRARVAAKLIRRVLRHGVNW